MIKEDIEFQARTAILFCERAGKDFRFWAAPKDFNPEDEREIFKLFKNYDFRKVIFSGRDNTERNINLVQTGAETKESH